MDDIIYKYVINLVPPKPKPKPKLKRGPRPKPIEERKMGTDKIYCDICNCYIQRRIKARHSRTFKHIFKNYLVK